jgi:hypothetical protein
MKELPEILKTLYDAQLEGLEQLKRKTGAK